MKSVLVHSILALFTAHASASPFPIDLSTRQAGTYDGPDAMDPSRPGTFHCFKGGKWMPQETVSGVIDQACTSTAEHDGDNVHFSFVPSADGTFPHQQVDHQFRACRSDQSGPLVCQPASGVVSFTGDIKSAARANSNDCTYAMQRIIDICHGEHEDTRGGWWQYDSDGTTYGVDPAE